MTQQHRIRIDLTEIVVEPINRCKRMVWCDIVFAMFPGNMDHVIHVPGEHDAALTKSGNVVYFRTSHGVLWTNHDRVI